MCLIHMGIWQTEFRLAHIAHKNCKSAIWNVAAFMIVVTHQRFFGAKSSKNVTLMMFAHVYTSNSSILPFLAQYDH